MFSMQTIPQKGDFSSENGLRIQILLITFAKKNEQMKISKFKLCCTHTDICRGKRMDASLHGTLSLDALLMAATRVGSQSYYIVDATTYKVLCHTPNLLARWGEHFEPDDAADLSGNLTKHFTSESVALLLQAMRIPLPAKSFAQEVVTDICISVNMELKRSNKYPIWVYHRATPLFLHGTKGLPTAYLCAFSSLVTKQKKAMLQCQKGSCSCLWQASATDKQWQAISRPTLTDIQIDILRLSVSGFSVDGIADRLHRSKETIKTHRRKLFQMLGVESIEEAISIASSLQLI